MEIYIQHIVNNLMAFSFLHVFLSLIPKRRDARQKEEESAGRVPRNTRQ